MRDILARSDLLDLPCNKAFRIESPQFLSSLLDFQEAIDIASDTEGLINHMLRKTHEMISAKAAAIFLVDTSTQEFKLAAAIPVGMKALCGREMNALVDDGNFGLAVNQRRPTVLPSRRFGKADSRTILQPLMVSYKTLGMLLVIIELNEDAVTRHLLVPLSMAAKQFALTLRNHRLFDDLRRKNGMLDETKKALERKVVEMQTVERALTASLEELETKSRELENLKDSLEAQVDRRTRELVAANAELQRLYRTDGLTGLVNRQYLEEAVLTEDSFINKQPTEATIVVVDVNNLKYFNDTLGHEQGDLIIKEVAQLLSSCAREHDIVARFGGDEFVVIMPQTPMRAAKSYTRRIQRALRRLNKDREGQVDISFAVGFADTSEGHSVMSTFNAADYRMYQDKQRYYRQLHRHKYDQTIQPPVLAPFAPLSSISA